MLHVICMGIRLTGRARGRNFFDFLQFKKKCSIHAHPGPIIRHVYIYHTVESMDSCKKVTKGRATFCHAWVDALFAKYLGFQVILKFPKHTPFRNLFSAAPMDTRGAPRALRDLSTCGEELRAPWSSSFMCAMCCSRDSKFIRRFLIGNCPLASKGETKSNPYSRLVIARMNRTSSSRALERDRAFAALSLARA